MLTVALVSIQHSVFVLGNMSESRLTRVKVILCEPQDPINIGATVRAMKNMGVSQLRLVRPVAYDPYRLIGVAHDTHEIIEAIEEFETLEAAIADCVLVAGFTARRRAERRGIVTAAMRSCQRVDRGSLHHLPGVAGPP